MQIRNFLNPHMSETSAGYKSLPHDDRHLSSVVSTVDSPRFISFDLLTRWTLSCNQFHSSLTDPRFGLLSPALSDLIHTTELIDYTDYLEAAIAESPLCEDCVFFLESLSSPNEPILRLCLFNFLVLLTELSKRTRVLASPDIAPILIDHLTLFFSESPEIIVKTLAILRNIFLDAKETPELFPLFVERGYHSLILSVLQRDDCRPKPVFKCLACLLDSSVRSDDADLFPPILNSLLPLKSCRHLDAFVFKTISIILSKAPSCALNVCESPFLAVALASFAPDCPAALNAFRMATRVVLSCGSIDWCWLIDRIDWESFRAFLYLRPDGDPARAEMLRFASAAVGASRPILDHLMGFGFFADLLAYTGGFSFAGRELSFALLAAAIRTGTAGQRCHFFAAGALPVLLCALEESDADSAGSVAVAEGALGALLDLWGACEAAGKAGEFLLEFAEYRGFQVLAELEICREQADQLAEALPDPGR
jgi:hypothetical protein